MKNILYFDEKKLFSLTSQVFAGVTEFLIKEKLKETTDTETQKGSLASGKVVADAITSAEKDTERRIMHDYAFSLFEAEIINRNLVQEISPKIAFSPPDLMRPFVRISAPARIFDVKKATDIMSEFNSLTASLGYVQSKDAVEKAAEPLSQAIAQTKDKQKAASLAKQKELFVKSMLNEISPPQDQKFLDHMVKIARFGFEDSLEIHQMVDAKRFTSCLKRDCLREDESLMVRKYSRTTKMDFVVLGVITNYPEDAGEAGQAEVAADESEKSLKEAFVDVIQSLGNLERTFSDVDKREYMIDPIAIYVTLGAPSIRHS
ncbi:hypothetical protein J2W39_004513 [Variovorax paradoxus]|uniref:Uncharacterized protein n=1 Tax=Variovorax paradoxus TaxID=34073 RepID=A0AAW8EN05_VARPD|nr:hypothetical protein [Variovorax paradoxus]MDP9973266.1 hypothetical protein [Variovorax paradoxus]